MLIPPGCKDIVIRKSEFVANTRFLYFEKGDANHTFFPSPCNSFIWIKPYKSVSRKKTMIKPEKITLRINRLSFFFLRNINVLVKNIQSYQSREKISKSKILKIF